MRPCPCHPTSDARPAAPDLRRAGFSLVELTVAIALLGIVLAATFGLMTTSLGLRRTSTRAADALQLASSHLEAYKRTWSDLGAYMNRPGLASPTLPPAPSADQDPRTTAFTWDVAIDCLLIDGSVVPCGANPNPELRRVTVVLSEAGSGAVAARVSTEIGRPFDPDGTS